MKDFVLIIYLFVGVIFCCSVCLFIKKKIHRIKTRISFKQSIKKAELVIIPLYNGNKKLNFIVDSGSTCNIIDASILNELYIYKENVNMNNVQSISISGNANADSVVSMMLKNGNETFYETFFVMDLQQSFAWSESEYGEKVHGLLGTDFLEHYGKVIDFNNHTIYSKK